MAEGQMPDPELKPAQQPDGFYQISPEELTDMNEERNMELFTRFGGVQGVASALHSDLATGLDPHTTGSGSFDDRQRVFGYNKYKEIPPKNFFVLLWSNLKDPTLVMLIVAAAVSTVLGVAIKEEREQSAWSEGVAIFIAVMVVSCVGAGNDVQKDRQFQKLNKQKDIIEVTVVRGGQELLVSNLDIVVGDVLVLDTGDKVVADGIISECHGLVIDEASLTGESEPIKKGDKDPWCRSGTQITEGSGRCLIVAVGEQSEWGKTMAMVMTEAGDTPLQEKLGVVASAIGKIGLAVGTLCFVVLMVRWMISNKGFPVSKIPEGPLNYFIFAVTVVVVAVPEGLPLAVTISLAYSMKKMMKDNNFVRVLAACETMGGATAICSDKTGTLTENRMTVVEGWFGGRKYAAVPDKNDLSPEVAREIHLGCAINSKAFLIEHEKDVVEFVGNRTECALLMLLRKWGISYKQLREEQHEALVQIYGFSSEKKMASVLLKTPSGFRLYNKGAAEIVLTRCTSWWNDQTGEEEPMTDGKREELGNFITAMANSGLRTLMLSHTDFNDDPARPPDYFETAPDQDLCADAIVGIKDPVRKEVPDAVATCKRAGIMVRMVTGDNIYTARHIAQECGILFGEGIALEGPAFRRMPEDEIVPLLPKLQVLARSSPQDKYTLVQLLKKQGEVVAVTGDGTNDAPALKESDVGLAMGIAGTEVAKEAADIVIMDDNFSSIVKSVLWGRSVFNNIRKFLQFQLTVNGVALVVAFVAAITTGTTPLTVLQLLWVNLIMDSMAALALATEDPTPELLLNKPNGRNEPLINGTIWKHILVQTCYQTFWLFLIIFGAPALLSTYSLPTLCPAYSHVDTHELRIRSDLSYIPSTLYTIKEPHLDTKDPWWPLTPAANGERRYLTVCCSTNATLLSSGYPSCNVAEGGMYFPGERPLCLYNSEDPITRHPNSCTRREPKDEADKRGFCGGSNTDCDRYKDMRTLYDRGNKQYKEDLERGRNQYNSVVFNAFIFMQIFNEFNARKIADEYNVFAGLWKSKMFIYVFIITVACQIVIIQTPVAGFFKVTSQDWKEWLAAIGIGLGVLPVAFITKLISWRFKPRPQHSSSPSAVQASR